ncbi:MAG TPA: ankyrin repeat domain-containing protein [Amoebophilaceae bacterium]|nr:ankyrin repeat domain-containing protein [Amoebophilaceae bacterium]
MATPRARQRCIGQRPKGIQHCVKELLQARSDPNSEDDEGHTPFCFALVHNFLGRESGGNWVNHTDRAGTPLLHHAILGNHPTLLAELLASSTLAVNAQDTERRTALQLAAEKNLLSLVQQLLALRGIDVNKKDNEEKTALYAAVAHEHMESAKVFMQLPNNRGASRESPQPDASRGRI